MTTGFAATLSVGKKSFSNPLLQDASFDGFKESVHLGLEFSFNWKGAAILVTPRLGLSSISKKITANDATSGVSFDFTVPEAIYYTEIDYGLRFHKTLLGFIEPTIAIGRTTTILNYSTVENVEIKNNKFNGDHLTDRITFHSNWYSYGIRFYPKIILIGLEIKHNFAPELDLLGKKINIDSQEMNLYFDIGF